MNTGLVAILITTNIVRVACSCGFCHDGVAVPEHINALGYDLKQVVSTNYLPVVNLDSEKQDKPKGRYVELVYTDGTTEYVRCDRAYVDHPLFGAPTILRIRHGLVCEERPLGAIKKWKVHNK